MSLAGGLTALGHTRAAGQRSPSPGRSEEEARVRELARKAGLGPLTASRSPHFLAVGDAPEVFLQSALRHCEALSEALLRHLRGKGFELAFPAEPLTVVALKGQESYGRLLGEAPGKDVGGHYDLETNRLVIFDFRAGPGAPAKGAERLNLFTLVHETTHLVSFNTGVLARGSPPPLCLSEGFATYVELWEPGARNTIGGLNRPRLKALRDSEDWIPVSELLATDDAFEGEQEQLAYAESWLLTQHFLRAAGRVPRFREYLVELGKGLKRAEAVAAAETRLGSLKRLDRTLKDEARRYLAG
jgi:hypothetical protein